MKLKTLLLLICLVSIHVSCINQTWHKGTQICISIPEKWNVSNIKEKSFIVSHSNNEYDEIFQNETKTEFRFNLIPYPDNLSKEEFIKNNLENSTQFPFKKVTFLNQNAYSVDHISSPVISKSSSTLKFKAYKIMTVTPLESEMLILVIDAPLDSYKREESIITSFLKSIKLTNTKPFYSNELKIE